MKLLVGIVAAVILVTATGAGYAILAPGGEAVNILRHTMKDIDDNEVDLSQYLGQVVMIVNVASKCGFTPQYKELEELYQKYKDDGFVILGFPANDFLRQEPGSDEEIKSFCSLNYGVTFPIFSKITVLGRNKAPLYEDLVSKKTNPEHSGMIKWNFSKFLIGREGKVINRFAPTTSPNDKSIVGAIEKALKDESANAAG